ncbi:hypothetical protein ACP70R_015645 [Stipagrostis hirtigluma subsp. patula]
MASSSASRSAGRSWEFGSRPSPIRYRRGAASMLAGTMRARRLRS